MTPAFGAVLWSRAHALPQHCAMDVHRSVYAKLLSLCISFNQWLLQNHPRNMSEIQISGLHTSLSNQSILEWDPRSHIFNKLPGWFWGIVRFWSTALHHKGFRIKLQSHSCPQEQEYSPNSHSTIWSSWQHDVPGTQAILSFWTLWISKIY